MSERLTVGQAAQCLDISPKTIRYYETIGLLPAMERAANGYRRLRAHDVNRLRFIRRAKSLGLTLDEIRMLALVAEDGECQRISAELREIVESKIRECDERIASLTAFRASLERVLRQIGTDEHDGDEAHPEGHTPFSPACTCLPDPT